MCVEAFEMLTLSLKRSLLLIIFLLVASNASAQNIIRGTFLDSLTKQPIAFVHILLDDGKTGATSDIEGNFECKLSSNYSGLLTTSHISYKKVIFRPSDVLRNHTIFLAPSSTLLKEVEFTAEENPAFRIIRKATANREKNDPENLKSYQYISYNKFLATVSESSKKSDSTIQKLKTQPDSIKLTKDQKAMLKFDSMFQHSHLFMSESVTEKKVIRPGSEKEKLLALKVSGFKSAIFTNVATDYQPFSFYRDQISLLGKDFVNPIAKGTFSRYDFYLLDTSYTDQDTTYIIQYQPKPKSFFPSLTGVLSIDNKDFAIKNVIASSSDTLAYTNIRIRQNYEKVDGHWFPVQLNTDLDFVKQELFGRHLIVHHRSFLKEIQINPSLSKREFGDIKKDLTLPNKAENDLLLEKFRNKGPDRKEARTYTLLDSMTKKIRWMDKGFDALATQAIPMGIFEFDLNRLFGVNNYERFRLGAGLYTSNRFSKWLRLGGYAGYGFGDDRWKYGGEVRFNFNPDKDSYLRLTYANDIYETGYSRSGRNTRAIASESFRTWGGKQYDIAEVYKAEIAHRILPDVHLSLFVQRSEVAPTYNYQFLFNGELINHFLISETGVTVRYAKNENYMSLNGKKVFLRQQFPFLSFTAGKAISAFGAQNFNYYFFDLNAMHLVKHRNGTKSYLSVSAGWMDELAPYGRLYNGRGADGALKFYVENYFQTMGLYEFTASRYASVFLNHNFGNILINKKYSKPEFVLYHNMGVGALDNRQIHFNIPIKTFENGFYESGVGLNNLIRANYVNVAFFGFGGSLFYRYGEYAQADPQKNLFWRLNFGISF